MKKAQSFPKIKRKRKKNRIWTTVRKSSGGVAPLKQLSKLSSGHDTTTISANTAEPSSLDFGFKFSSSGTSKSPEDRDDDNDDSTKNCPSSKELSQFPIFDLNDSQQVKTYLPQYTVQRQVTVSPNLTEIEQTLINVVVADCKRRYRKSNWVIIYHVETSKDDKKKSPFPGVEWVAEQQLEQCIKQYPYSHYEAWEPNISKLLETGQLQGCELRGRADTAQLGLVANQDLVPGTPVAIEAGELTSPVATATNSDNKKMNNNPLEALSSNEIPMTLLTPFLRSKKAKTVYRQYLASRRYQNPNNTTTTKDSKGFVVDCQHMGNETKFIDDASWLQAGSGKSPRPPNLESSLIFDLQRHTMTVIFFTTKAVHKGEELTMDWGCWKEISQVLLPGQVLLSLICDKKVRDLKKKFSDKAANSTKNNGSRKRKSITRGSDDNELISLQNIHELSAEEYGPRFEILRDIYLQRDSSNSAAAMKQPVSWYKRLPVNTIDYTSPEVRHVVRPAKGTPHYPLLSNETRSKLNEIRRTSIDKPVRDLLKETDLSTRVEVVEITNVCHPAFLLSLPGQTAYGVIAKRPFQTGEPVLCYGGILIDDESDFEFDSYLFDIDISPYCCEDGNGESNNSKQSSSKDSHKVAVAGSSSVAGKINDPLSLFGYDAHNNNNNHEANLQAWNHFDGEQKVPQVVLYATKDIAVGEELLYEYGMDYWKIMWKIFMMEHANFVADANTKILKTNEKWRQRRNNPERKSRSTTTMEL